MMRRTFLWSVLAFAFVLVLPAQAQNAQKDLTAAEYAEYLQIVEQIEGGGGDPPTGEMIEIANVSMSNSKILSQDGRTVVLAFDIINNGNVQPGLKYAVQLYGKGDLNNGYLVDEQVYGDVVALANGESVEKTITYEIPEGLSGPFALTGVIANDRGLEFGFGTFGDIAVGAEAEGITIYGKSCALMVNGDEEFDLMQGIDVASNEKIELLCAIENTTDNDITFVPHVETRLRTVYGDVLSKEETAQQSIAAHSQEFVKLPVPITMTPQSYYARIVLMDGKNVVSNAVSARYVTQGESATVQNVNLDKMAYSTGDIAQLQVFVSGRADQFPQSRNQEKMNDQALSFSIKIISGELVCAASQDHTFTQAQMKDGVVDVTMSITNDCSNPIVVIAAKDENGAILDQKDFSLNTDADENVTTNTEKSGAESQIPVVLWVVLILTIIVIVIILIVRYKKRPPLHMFIGFLIIGFGLFVVSDSVSAVTVTGSGRTMTYDLKNEKGSVLGDPATYDQCEEVYIGASATRTACGNHDQRLEMYAAIISPGGTVALSEENVIFRETVDAGGICTDDDDHDGIPNWNDADAFGGKIYIHEHACLWDLTSSATFASKYHTKNIGFVAPGDHIMGFRLWSAQPWGWSGWRTNRVYDARFGPPVAGTQMCSYCTHDLNYQLIPEGDRDGESCPCFKGTYDLQKELPFAVIQSSISDKAVTSKDFCAKNPLVDGKCGLNSTAVPQRWAPGEMIVDEYCAEGTKSTNSAHFPSGYTVDATKEQWVCLGTGVGGDTSLLCEAPIPEGVCGMAGTPGTNSFLEVDMPTAVGQLCGADNNIVTALSVTSPFSSATANWTWSCQYDSGFGAITPCSANLIGECGPAAKATDEYNPNRPTVDLCNSGEATTVLGGGGAPWTWDCQGTGPVSNTKNCSVASECEADLLQCTASEKCIALESGLTKVALLTDAGAKNVAVSARLEESCDQTVICEKTAGGFHFVEVSGNGKTPIPIIAGADELNARLDAGDDSVLVKYGCYVQGDPGHKAEGDTTIEFGCQNAVCSDKACKKDTVTPVSSISACQTQCSSNAECVDSTGVITEVQP